MCMDSKKINKVYCFFEQSGVFKNQFLSLGINAECYDIRNDFQQTNHIMDLFKEINNAYDNKPSIFDDITTDDLIFAFFPCIRFENQIMLHFRGQANGMQKWSLKKKMMNCMKLQDELTEMYKLVNKLFIICLDKNLKLIFENPYSQEHYLRRYWCYQPNVIDTDRRIRGDYYKKPTQYFFVNFEPSNNVIQEESKDNSLNCKDTIRMMNKSVYYKTGAKNARVARSMIHPDYANRFIREYIL